MREIIDRILDAYADFRLRLNWTRLWILAVWYPNDRRPKWWAGKFANDMHAQHLDHTYRPVFREFGLPA